MAASTTTIASFPTSSGNGTEPDGQLFMASNGDLLGATVNGGANGMGTTYEIVKTGGGFAGTPTFLADIPNGFNTLVGVPNLGADAAGDLFGLERTGGANTLGAVIEFPAVGGTITLPTTFAGGAGGSQPSGKLLVDPSGNLFGTTPPSGGSNPGPGTVFEITKTAGVYATAPTILTSFSSGIVPFGSGNLVEDAAGDLFGTTTNSSVFEVQKTGASYASPVSLLSFPVGTQIGDLTMDATGDIFGTTISSAANDHGSVFEIEKTANGYASAPITLASFALADGQLSLNHFKALIVDANGDLFGTTDPSSQNSGGVVYEIVKTSVGYASTPRIVEDFNGSATVGLGANVVADSSGDLFGTMGSASPNGGVVVEITNSGFATTPTPPPPASPVSSDFNFDGRSDFLWQNTDGQAATWEMNGTSILNAAAVGSNPGPSWKAIGTGDFNADGHADILWQNANGQAAIWEMNGTNVLNNALVGSNPGPSWQEIGTGDFNGDGKSDILWQNTDGQAAIWDMDGTSVLSTAAVGANPGPDWKEVGTGDFNGDGHTDILWQDTDGQAAIWELDGHGNVLTTAAVGANPGPSWQVIGTGDFNGDGKSDILWQNTDGQAAIWDMNGTNVLSMAAVGSDPGPDWKVVGAGDYNGDGHADIRWQNTSGQAAIWEMDGNGHVLNAALVGANPGPSWLAVKA